MFCSAKTRYSLESLPTMLRHGQGFFTLQAFQSWEKELISFVSYPLTPDVFENFLSLGDWVRNCSLHEWMQRIPGKQKTKYKLKPCRAQDRKPTQGCCESLFLNERKVLNQGQSCYHMTADTSHYLNDGQRNRTRTKQKDVHNVTERRAQYFLFFFLNSPNPSVLPPTMSSFQFYEFYYSK